MNVDTRINLNLSQRLVMTPMLQQAIKLLQMSRLELVDLVKQEMLENPVLEELEDNAENEQQEDDFSSYDAHMPDERYDDAPPLSDQPDIEGAERQPQQESSVNWEEYFNDNPGGLGYTGEFEPDDNNQSFDNLFSRPQSLSEHLAWQLQMSQLPERAMKIGQFLIGQIGDDGYLFLEDQSDAPTFNIYSSNIPFKQLEEYHATVNSALCQKINSEFERDYLAARLDFSGSQAMLANVALQEYYNDLIEGHYRETIEKLRHFTLEDYELIAKSFSELSLHQVESLTGIPMKEIEPGLKRLAHICRTLPQLIERHCSVLVKDTYLTKLEKLELSQEELYLVEYLLSNLSAAEVAYIGYKEQTDKATKHEAEIHEALEKLRQSYAHIEQLTSHKYYLIQLYTIGLSLIGERFTPTSPIRFQKFFLKVMNITEDEIAGVANVFRQIRSEFYAHEEPIVESEVEAVLKHIQTFMPTGVGARDFKECLLIQAKSLDLLGTEVEQIIAHYLHELERHRYEFIAHHLNISKEEVESAQQIIANMSPRPGGDFVAERPEYIVPDIYVYKVDGDYEVVLNEDDLPNLRINPTYKKILTSNERDVSGSTRQYVDQKLRSAMWFIRSVEQRKRTVYKVGKSIVKFQKNFLEYGVSHLKPLVLRDVADDISMHESTISRVTTNKYIHTPQGVFELKYFFHSGLESSSGGDDVSSRAVKKKIKQMIDEENPEHPLSDKDIEKRLTEEGVAIARRTIAKYREDMNILSSIDRKRKK
ncbi:RNA polymerase, sigma 54 subunit, RpoN [Candidatus Moduliflexus flocculans]|uniref:RNA polymerase, sigma 54 subunit, RpoN n=1 Tax=Candidatus Moduliflexus flocculans TaxID=1499966 RepID=A0A0S6VZP4_9BACT|nr:RNA polymerase, sigma 54 subunit, RpoN [Candidatus Moduliflexus flocculans]